MPLKGVIQKDIIPGNEYKLIVDNVEIICTELSGFEEALQTAELPDGTVATTGRTDATEFTVSVPYHHEDDIAFMDSWWAACKTPVQAAAYKTATAVASSSSGAVTRTSTATGCFIKNRKSPDFSMGDGGTEMTVVEYTISADEVEHA
jgi:hypothetical protein